MMRANRRRGLTYLFTYLLVIALHGSVTPGGLGLLSPSLDAAVAYQYHHVTLFT